MLQRLVDRYQIEDTARVNLELASGLRGAEDLDVEGCLRTLDGWARLVASETERLRYLFRRNPSAFDGSEARFRVMTLVTVLQRDLGVHYRQELIDMPDDEFFLRADHIFMHGVIQGKGGSCSSLPPTFAAVARRLGYPVRIVKASAHLFARWDDPHTGECFNFDCAMRGFLPETDDHYRRWPREMTLEQEQRYGALRSQTPLQEIAVYVATRGHCLYENGRLDEAANAYARAADMDPDDASHLELLEATMNRWNRNLSGMLMPGFPPMRVSWLRRRYPRIPAALEEGIFHMKAKEMILSDPTWNRRWWFPLWNKRKAPPADLPAFISVQFPEHLGEDIEIRFLDAVPGDFDHANAQPC